MKLRAKANGNPSPKPVKPTRDRARIVEAMAAKGLSADVIAACLNTDRNTLRGQHALSLHNGREKAKKQKVEAKGGLTREEMCCADVMLSSFASGSWVDPVCGSLLWIGLDGGAAKTAASAYAAWLRAGGKFITTGIDKSFGPERIAEFVALKREAQRLLGVQNRLRRGKAPSPTRNSPTASPSSD
jgi:hypothetical protein